MSDWDNIPVFWTPDKKEEVKVCTCGVKITMGKDDHIDYHSHWCDLKRDNKKEEHETKK